jgi:hypothetical protein
MMKTLRGARTTFTVPGVLVITSWFFFACSGDESDETGPCSADDPPAACGQPCSVAEPCPQGFYCTSEGECTQDCAVDADCVGGRCDVSGHCYEVQQSTDGGSAGGGYPADGSDVCATSVPARPVTPNVIIIIDQSGSMDESFGGSTDRWNALRDTLLQSGGLIETLQGVVRFGVVLYTAADGNPVCPLLTVAPEDPAAPGEVLVSLNAYDAIREVYQSAGTVEDTPTGDAIDAVLNTIAGSELVTGTDPTIFILATDGEPDRCEQLDPNPTDEAQAEAVAAVRRAFDQHAIQTFVIAVADEQELSQSHVNDLANAGQGIDAAAGEQVSESFRVANADQLAATLQSIVGGQLTCTIDLQGTLTDTGDGCAGGVVRLNGRVVPCDENEGWRLVNNRQFRLHGAYCDELLDTPGAQIEASFPCGTVNII